VAQLKNQKDRAADGDRTQEMRRDRDRVRVGDEAVAEKKAWKPTSDDNKRRKRKRGAKTSPVSG
jgi:hypothetical protein